MCDPERAPAIAIPIRMLFQRLWPCQDLLKLLGRATSSKLNEQIVRAPPHVIALNALGDAGDTSRLQKLQADIQRSNCTSTGRVHAPQDPSGLVAAGQQNAVPHSGMHL